MRLSQAVSEAKDVKVTFAGGATLAVTYRPLSYTVREMDAARADAENTDRIIDTMKRLIVRWDLTDDDDRPIALDFPYDEVDGKQVPSPDDPLRDIPTNVFTEILTAIAEDAKPSGEASRGSAAR